MAVKKRTMSEKLVIYFSAYSTKSKVSLDDWFSIREELVGSREVKNLRARTK